MTAQSEATPRAARVARGRFSQRRWARMIGVSERTVSRWEDEDGPGPTRIQALAMIGVRLAACDPWRARELLDELKPPHELRRTWMTDR